MIIRLRQRVLVHVGQAALVVVGTLSAALLGYIGWAVIELMSHPLPCFDIVGC